MYTFQYGLHNTKKPQNYCQNASETLSKIPTFPGGVCNLYPYIFHFLWDINVRVLERSYPGALSNGACNAIVDRTVAKPHPPKLSP